MKDEEVSRQLIKEIDELRHQLHDIAQDAGEFGRLDDEGGIQDANDADILLSVTDTIQVWASGVVGYIWSITDDSYVLRPSKQMRARAIASLPALQRADIFDIDWFWDWYQHDIARFPHIKRYIQTVDYLRLLGISYLTLHVMPKYATDKETQD